MQFKSLACVNAKDGKIGRVSHFLDPGVDDQSRDRAELPESLDDQDGARQGSRDLNEQVDHKKSRPREPESDT